MCPLNKTAVIAGQKESTYSSSGPGGYAFLRHVPVVNWFLSSREDLGEELQLLILVCPQIANRRVQMTAVPSGETANVENAVSKSVNEKSEKIHRQETLNWFQKMFTW